MYKNKKPKMEPAEPPSESSGGPPTLDNVTHVLVPKTEPQDSSENSDSLENPPDLEEAAPLRIPKNEPRDSPVPSEGSEGPPTLEDATAGPMEEVPLPYQDGNSSVRRSCRTRIIPVRFNDYCSDGDPLSAAGMTLGGTVADQMSDSVPTTSRPRRSRSARSIGTAAQGASVKGPTRKSISVPPPQASAKAPTRTFMNAPPPKATWTSPRKSSGIPAQSQIARATPKSNGNRTPGKIARATTPPKSNGSRTPKKIARFPASRKSGGISASVKAGKTATPRMAGGGSSSAKTNGVSVRKTIKGSPKARGIPAAFKKTCLIPSRPASHEVCFMCGDKAAAVKAVRKIKIELDWEGNDDTQEEGKVAKHLNVKKEPLDEDDTVPEEVQVVKKVTKKEQPESDTVRCGFPRCVQRMHKSCAQDYICSEYSPYQAQLLFRTETPVCPSHFCWHCYDERYKNSSRFGTLVDCEKCFRSFHTQCVPAGSKVKKNGQKRTSFVCHYHPASTKTIAKATRLQYCADCEDPVDKNDKERVECKGCTQVFHRSCSFSTVSGTNLPGKGIASDFCSYCLVGSVIVPNQYVLAYYGHSFAGQAPGTYPAIALALNDVPSHIVKQLGSNLGKPGWIPVQWVWDGIVLPYYNLLPKSRVQRMTVDCHKNLSNKEFTSELKTSMRKFKPPYVKLNNEEMRKTINIVETSFYMKGVPRLCEQKRITDEQSCECKPDKEGFKCRDNCVNKDTHTECLPSCDAPGEKCLNRSMQQKGEKKKLFEVRLTEKKGFGAFAIEHIKAGAFIAEYAGEIINKEEKDRREKRLEVLRSIDEYTYVMGLAKNIYLDARFHGGEARYMNHSCEPNAEVDSFDIPFSVSGQYAKYEPRLKIHALRDIKPGDEITFNYGLGRSGNLRRDRCYCGTASCSRWIGAKKEDGDMDDAWGDSDGENMDDEEMNEGVISESEDEKMEEEEKENKKNAKKPVKRPAKRKANNGKTEGRRSSVVGLAAKKRRVSSMGTRNN